MLYVRRILAQLVDLISGCLILLVTFVYILPFIARFIPGVTVQAVLGIVIVVALTALVQYPFMRAGQTLGKGFFALKIISTDEQRAGVPVAVIVQREILCKLFSCFIICLPMLGGKAGGHEEATHTKVVGK